MVSHSLSSLKNFGVTPCLPYLLSVFLKDSAVAPSLLLSSILIECLWLSLLEFRSCYMSCVVSYVPGCLL